MKTSNAIFFTAIGLFMCAWFAGSLARFYRDSENFPRARQWFWVDLWLVLAMAALFGVQAAIDLWLFAFVAVLFAANAAVIYFRQIRGLNVEEGRSKEDKQS